jgi:hypothetical protein
MGQAETTEKKLNHENTCRRAAASAKAGEKEIIIFAVPTILTTSTILTIFLV